MSCPEYIEQRSWADQFIDNQKAILMEYKSRLDFTKTSKRYDFRIDNQKDMQENTDLLMYEFNSLSVALRIRNADTCKFRDVTIRTFSQGYKTEFDKLMEGYGHYMLYCWGKIENAKPTIREYILFDLDIFRKNHLRYLISGNIKNTDGVTSFNAYDCKKIVTTPCCIAVNIPNLFNHNGG